MMPKPRTVDRFFWDDPDVSELSRDERLLMLGLFTKLADDEGRFLADPAYVRKEIFGYDVDLTNGKVLDMLTRVCEKFQTWHPYYVGGHRYVQIDADTWKKHQDIRWVVRSKLPPPDGHTQSNERLGTSEDFGSFQKSSENFGSRDARAVGLGSVVLGSVETPPKSPPAGGVSRSRKRDYSQIGRALGAERTRWWLEFWALYPSHDGKLPAMDAFERVVTTMELWSHVRAGVQRYRDKVKADPTLKVKYAQGWLGDARWDDECSPEPRASAGGGIAERRRRAIEGALRDAEEEERRNAQTDTAGSNGSNQ